MPSFEWPPTGGGGGGGSGTVTSVSVVSANGLAGSVANASSTPAITLRTTVTGILLGNGTSIAAATAGTDYVIPSGSITGTASNITGTSNSSLVTLSALSLPYSQLSGSVPTWNQNTSGTAANITASSNSSLVTLSALSLPGSQVTGTVPAATTATTAGNITASSNSTITTLTALALPESQVTNLAPFIGCWQSFSFI